MRLIKCNKPDGKLEPLDTPLNVRGELFQSYSKELDGDKYEHYEHNQTKDTWMKLIREN